jgi:chromosome segregation ATPase
MDSMMISSSSSSSPSNTLATIAVEERLIATQKDMEHITEALRMKESAYQDLERDCKYHQIKSEELAAVLNVHQARIGPDETHVVLRLKAEQNAELKMQAMALRDLLDQSTAKMDHMEKELIQTTESKKSLLQVQKNHQRVMVQINGLVQTLQRVQVSVDIPSDWIQSKWLMADDSMHILTRKIIAIEADRQRLLKESRVVKEEYETKDERITILERQIRSMERDHDDILEENQAMKRELDLRAGKIGALEELFQNINTTRSIDAGSGNHHHQHHNHQRTHQRHPSKGVPHDVECDDKTVSVMDIDDDDSIEIASHTNGTTEMILTSNTFDMVASQMPDVSTDEEDATRPTRGRYNNYYTADDDDDDDEATAATVRAELVMLKDRCGVLHKDLETSRRTISDLQQEVLDTKQHALTSEKKAELREGLLKDVIQQYKDLQKEHSTSNEQLERLKHTVTRFIDTRQHQQRSDRDYPKTKGTTTAAAASATGTPEKGYTIAHSTVTANDENRPHTVEETPSLDMTEATTSLASEEEDVDSHCGVEIHVDRTHLWEDYQRLENECDRLRHEFETAISKVATLEEELSQANNLIKDSRMAHAHQAHSIAVLENEKTRLQEQLDDHSRKLLEANGTQKELSLEHQDSLRMAELQIEQARSKQKQREEDLWDVIEQYKQLVELNASTKEQMHNVEEELRLTHKVKIQRRDLVYEYRKLERGTLYLYGDMSFWRKKQKRSGKGGGGREPFVLGVPIHTVGCVLPC